MILALRARPELWRFVKFLVVGVINTAFGWIVYGLLLRVGGLPWQVALALAYVIGVLWNFATHARLVFRTRGLSRLPAYILAYAAIFLVNRWLLGLLIGAGLSELWAQALLLPAMAVLAFFLIAYVLTGRIPLVRRSGQGGPG